MSMTIKQQPDGYVLVKPPQTKPICCQRSESGAYVIKPEDSRDAANKRLVSEFAAKFATCSMRT